MPVVVQNTLEFTSLYNSSSVNHIITNSHLEDSNTYNFQWNNKSPLHTLNLCCSACSELRMAPFTRGGKSSRWEKISLSTDYQGRPLAFHGSLQYIQHEDRGATEEEGEKEGYLYLKTLNALQKRDMFKNNGLTEIYFTACSGW